MILDEPTSTLTEVEKGVLFRMMAALKASGIAILYITHRLEEVIEIADRFTVFRGGRRIATMDAADIQSKDLSLAELMLGESVGHIFPPRPTCPPSGAVALSVRKLRRPGVFDGVDFEVRHGEIMGIFGLVGSGLDELSKALFGVDRAESGTIVIDGQEVRSRSPREALKNGIFLVPGDRRAEGLTLTQSSVFNIKLADLDRASGPLGLLRRRGNRRRARELAAEVALTPPNLDRPVSSFSGGNQQKIVIAKGLFTEAKVYIFVEPTVGVDIGARSKLYALMRSLAERAAVIVMSTDCDEVHGLADRSFALYKGRQIAPAAGAMSRNDLLTAGPIGQDRRVGHRRQHAVGQPIDQIHQEMPRTHRRIADLEIKQSASGIQRPQGLQTLFRRTWVVGERVGGVVERFQPVGGQRADAAVDDQRHQFVGRVVGTRILAGRRIPRPRSTHRRTRAVRVPGCARRRRRDAAPTGRDS